MATLISLSACSLVGFWAGLGWLVLVYCERKTLLAGWFRLTETNQRTGCMYPSLSECYLQLKEELDKLIQQKLEDPNFDIHKEGKYILFAVQELAAGDLCEGRFVFGRETSRARLQNPEDDGKSNIIKDGMNPKSLLQTLLMQAGHTPPKYKTKHLKTNEFRAMVEFKGMQFVGKPKRNKQLAERDAAIEALGWLTQTSGVKTQDEDDVDSPLDLTDSMLKLLTRPRRHFKNNSRKR